MENKDKLKVANYYCGIGGNRKLWQDNIEVVAVEQNEKIAEIYADHFPNDTVIVGDAHEHLLKNFREFDFIWSSPPCPTHSKLRTLQKEVQKFQEKLSYPKLEMLNNLFRDEKFVNILKTRLIGKT